MKPGPLIVGGVAGAIALAGALSFVRSEVQASADRLAHPAQAAQAAPVADNTEAPYCTPQFKQVLQRVLNACGLVGQQDRRGCQPADVKTFASISDTDFNALFTPLEERGAIIMFDEAKDELDDGARKLVREKWDERKLARYFFVVARASKTGSATANRALSHRRANSVMTLLKGETNDPDLDKQVGMLWLGNEYAQLTKDYCAGWKNSRPGKPCNQEAINRSTFVSWVDCRL